MAQSDVLGRFDTLNIWRRGAQRAPHKPLLVLYAFGRWSRGETGPVPFRVLEPDLKRLLQEFGPSRRSYHPEYPFWHLQSDGVWRVDAATELHIRPGGSHPAKSELLRHDAEGRFTDAVLDALRQDSGLCTEIATRLLDSHFPESVHSDILSAVGLSLDHSPRRRPRRDPAFRERVLTTYEYRCAVCNLDVRLGGSTIALDAAHIQWHQAGGPDVEPNGLALCVMHHKTFDLGAFTVNPELTILVSEQVHGSDGVEETLMRFHGHPIRPPQRQEHRPGDEYLDWHEREVFKGKARHL